MSVHRSLAMKGGGRGHRNVLSRTERIAKLEDEGRWSEEESIFGLPKVRSIKVSAGKKAAKKKGEAAEGAEGVEGVEGAEAAEGAGTIPRRPAVDQLYPLAAQPVVCLSWLGRRLRSHTILRMAIRERPTGRAIQNGAVPPR